MNRYYVFFGLGVYQIVWAVSKSSVEQAFPNAERIYQM